MHPSDARIRSLPCRIGNVGHLVAYIPSSLVALVQPKRDLPVARSDSRLTVAAQNRADGDPNDGIGQPWC
jgi:hypothetical protein